MPRHCLSKTLSGRLPFYGVASFVTFWRVIRGGKRSLFEQACSLQTEAEDLLFGSEFEVDSRVVLELVRDSDCSVYDCEFIALAIKLNTKLVTADKKVLREFPTLTMALAAG